MYYFSLDSMMIDMRVKVVVVSQYVVDLESCLLQQNGAMTCLIKYMERRLPLHQKRDKTILIEGK